MDIPAALASRKITLVKEFTSSYISLKGIICFEKSAPRSKSDIDKKGHVYECIDTLINKFYSSQLKIW